MVSFESEVLDLTRKFKAMVIKLPVIEGKQFKDVTVWLDFGHYQNCKFEGCEIMLEYGIFKLIGCDFKTCKFSALPGTPAHAILLLDGLLKESAMLDKNR